MENCCCNDSILLLPGTASYQRREGERPMAVASAGIHGGIILDRFGKRGNEFRQDMPLRSLPLSISGAPEGTESFALTLLDYDAVPVAGFCWIHWIACNLMRTELPENASREHPELLVQGMNSWGSPLLGSGALSRADASCFGGMAPPNAPHRYLLTVYALDNQLRLTNGFYLNQLLEGMAGHILASASVIGIYDN